MKESATPVNNVITRQLQREVLNCIQIQFMKESVTPVNNVFTRQLQEGSLKLHIDSIHEGVRYSCEQCFYNSTTI